MMTQWSCTCLQGTISHIGDVEIPHCHYQDSKLAIDTNSIPPKLVELYTDLDTTILFWEKRD